MFVGPPGPDGNVCACCEISGTIRRARAQRPRDFWRREERRGDINYSPQCRTRVTRVINTGRRKLLPTSRQPFNNSHRFAPLHYSRVRVARAAHQHPLSRTSDGRARPHYAGRCPRNASPGFVEPTAESCRPTFRIWCYRMTLSTAIPDVVYKYQFYLVFQSCFTVEPVGFSVSR